MMKMKLCALTIMTLILFSGCSGRLDKPRRPQTLNPSAAPIMYTVDQYNKDFQEYTTAFKTNVALATRLRNAMINRIRADVETNYREYESILFFDRAKVNVGADLIELSLSLATTISNGERVKTVLGAILTGFKGVRLSIDKNFFREKATESIIAKMQANRTAVKNRIIDKMANLLADKYTFEEAMVDLAEFYYAGTLQSAIVSITNEAGRDAAEAQDRTEEIELFRTATAEEVATLTTIRNAFDQLFNSWNAVRNDEVKAKPFLDQAKNALKGIGVPFKETDSGDVLFRFLNEQIKKTRTDRSQLQRLTDAFKSADIIKQ
jgi:hypothetical protein